MVEAVSCNRPSAAKSIIGTSLLAGVLNAGLQAGYELYDIKTAPKNFKQDIDAFLNTAVAAEKAGDKKLSKVFFQQAEQLEQFAKNRKFSWKNVGRGALWGMVATAVLCTSLHALGAIFNRRK